MFKIINSSTFGHILGNNDLPQMPFKIDGDKNMKSRCHYDCKRFGHICCKLGKGKEECRTEENCPVHGVYLSV